MAREIQLSDQSIHKRVAEICAETKQRRERLLKRLYDALGDRTQPNPPQPTPIQPQYMKYDLEIVCSALAEIADTIDGTISV